MKTTAFILTMMLAGFCANAQSITLKIDTIFSDKAPYALFKESKTTAAHYFIVSLKGKPLAELHWSHLDVNGKQSYIITFLGDKRQSMIYKQPDFPQSFIQDVVKYNLVRNGSNIDESSETQFITGYPMPAGFTDIEKMVNY